MSVRPVILVGLIAAAASLAIGAAFAQECTANGINGRCRNTGECASIGWSTPGKCPGPDDFQCCTTAACPGGKCLRTSTCGGTSTPGLCPGPADVQCCQGAATPEGPPSCEVDETPGTCISTDVCSGKSGKSTPGFCPGPANIQCCTAAKTPDPSPSAAPPADLRFDVRVFIPTQLLDITSIFNLDDILPNVARGAFNNLIDQIKWGNGDGRGFAVSGGSSKADISFTIPSNPDGTSSGFDNLPDENVDRVIGVSKLYFGGIDTSRCGAAGVPDWGCGRLAPGAEPYLTQGQPLTDAKLSVQAKSVGSVAGRALVRVAVENGIGDLFDRAFNELAEGAVPGPLPIPNINFPTGPAINADFDITVTYVGPRRVKVAIAGSHDGFPSYEVYVNGRPLYQFNAIDPSALFPGSDQTIAVRTIDLDI